MGCVKKNIYQSHTQKCCRICTEAANPTLSVENGLVSFHSPPSTAIHLSFEICLLPAILDRVLFLPFLEMFEANLDEYLRNLTY